MNYTIELTPEDVMLIGTGLDLLPHGKVSALVRKVQTQINEQERAAANAPTAPAPAVDAKAKNRGGRPKKIREVAIPIEAAVHLTNGAVS